MRFLVITRHLEWQGYTCTKVAADLAEMRGIDKAHMARTLSLLEADRGRLGRLRGRERGVGAPHQPHPSPEQSRPSHGGVMVDQSERSAGAP